MASWQFDIKGTPATKKNSQRIIKVNGHNIIIPSAAYAKYERNAAQYLTNKPDQPIKDLCEVTCLYFMPRTKKGEIPKRKVDLANLLSATHDILVKYKILEDDNSSIIFSVDGSRVYYTTGEPHVIVQIRSLDDQIESGTGGNST